VNDPAPHLFAGSGLAGDQDGAVRLRSTFCVPGDLPHVKVLTKNPVRLRL
jgi:hypothetical protein